MSYQHFDFDLLTLMASTFDLFRLAFGNKYLIIF